MCLARDRNRFNSRSDDEDDYTQLEEDDYTQLEEDDYTQLEEDDYTQLEEDDYTQLEYEEFEDDFYDNDDNHFYDEDEEDEDPGRYGLQQVRYDPLVTEHGEVMLHDHMYQDQFTYYTNISRIDPFVKLEGLPPILIAHRKFFSLVLLTSQYEILIINESNPDGIILDTPPIKEMIRNWRRFYVLDKNHSLHELLHDNGSFYLSELYVPDVRLFTCDFREDLVVIDLSNKTCIFPYGNMHHNPITLELEQQIKYIVPTGSEVIMVDEDDNIWQLYKNRRNTIPNYRLIRHGTIDHPYRYIMYSPHSVYTIDYEGTLRALRLRIVYRMTEERFVTTESWEIIPGTYSKFFHIDQNTRAIEDESGRYHVLVVDEMVPLTLPFRLLSIQEYKERVRFRSMVKSARTA